MLDLASAAGRVVLSRWFFCDVQTHLQGQFRIPRVLDCWVVAAGGWVSGG